MVDGKKLLTQQLQSSQALYGMFLADFTDEEFFTPPCEKGNHAAWIVGHVGPLLIMGHYNPASTEMWGVPEFLVIKVVISTEKYKQLHDDLLERVRLNPVNAENACEFMNAPESGATLLELFHWFIENYPLEKSRHRSTGDANEQSQRRSTGDSGTV